MTNDFVVEIVQFKLSPDISDEDFLKASDLIMPHLHEQAGFIHRELLKNKSGEWIDMLIWERLDQAESAAKALMKFPICLEFFKLMDKETIKMSHYNQEREYKK